MNTTFCLLGSLLIAFAAQGHDSPSSTSVLASAKLLDDVTVLKQIYESAHPGLYRYNTKAQMDAHFAALAAEFARDRTLGDAFVVFSQFLAKVKCGHTYANFFNQPKDVAKALFDGKNKVPFFFRWIGGRMIVTRDLAPHQLLKPGTEVLELSGVSSAEILARLMTIARADGSNDAKRVNYLEVQGTAKFEAFDVFLPLFFPGIGGRMNLLVREPRAAEPVAITVDAHDLAQRAELAKQNMNLERDNADPVWRFDQLDDRTAILRMPTWALYNSKWDWRAFLDRGFDDLADRQIPGLIIDLRGNEGGIDVGNAIIARLATGQVRSARYQRFTRYRTLPFPRSFDSYLDTWDWKFKDWGTAARDERDGFFRMTLFDDDDKGDVISPRGKRYQGRVAVLIGAANSSATFQFAQIVKEQKLATLVGQTTGGNQRGINGGAFFFVTLPNSRIEVDLPLVGNFPGPPPWPTGLEIPFRTVPDAGIEPDVPVTPRIDDVARSVDTEVVAARSLLGSKSLP